jgi:hypothetical protein
MSRELRNACIILVGKPEGKRPCVRPRHRWENNINMYLRIVMREGMDWCAVVNMVTFIFYKSRECLDQISNYQLFRKDPVPHASRVNSCE